MPVRTKVIGVIGKLYNAVRCTAWTVYLLYPAQWACMLLVQFQILRRCFLVL